MASARFALRQRAILDNLPMMAWLKGSEGRLEMVNEPFAKAAGLSIEECIGKTDLEIWPNEEMAKRYMADDREVYMSHKKKQVEESISTPDGIKWHHTYKTPLFNEQGQVVGTAGVAQDITERKHAEEQLNNLSQRLLLATTSASFGVWDWNLLDNTMVWDDRMLELYGLTIDTFPGGIAAWELGLHPDDHDAVWEECQAALRGDKEWDTEFRLLHPNGTVRHIKADGMVIRDSEGHPTRMLGTNRDITEEKKAEKDLVESKFFFQESQRAAFIGSYKADFVSGTWESSEVLDKIFGIDGCYIKNIQGWLDIIYPDDREMLDRYLKEEVISNSGSFDMEYRIIHKSNGDIRWVLSLGKVQCDQSGNVIMMYGTIQDITERKRSEDEHNKLQEQLNQTQRLDSVGRLAGGIAHDFNNKLTVVLGYAELSKMIQCQKNMNCSDYTNEIIKAALHAQEITRRLLVFSRTDDASQIKLDLNLILSEFKKTLGRLIGENVSLQFKLQDDLWPVRTDPTQFDQIITNLVINARDAMSDGGTITVCSMNVTVDDNHVSVPSGDFVLVSCSDTGCGMDKTTLQHIFEPFFTTKEVGKGTGLGLSSVYGIVKQNNGYITVKSELGNGSIFSIFLPRLIENNLPDFSIKPDNKEMIGNGAILLVEDEDHVRKIVKLILETMGYDVIAAESPNQAIALCNDPQNIIDCVLSDIVMPEMDGLVMKDRIIFIRPALPFIFMSGYTPDIIKERFRTAEDITVLKKPIYFRQLHEILNQKIRKEGIQCG